MFWDQPIATFALCALVSSVIHGGFAAPTPDSDFTFVAHETDIPVIIDADTIPDSHITTMVPIATSIGTSPTKTYLFKEYGPSSDTTVMVPIGTASGANPATTYFYKEVHEYAVRPFDYSHKFPFTTETFIVQGTLIASASGYKVSAEVPGGGGKHSNAYIECRYIDSVEEECVLNRDSASPVTTRGPIFTLPLPSGSAPATVRATSVQTTASDN
ncbi:hypothetical protein GYMLUDRAFT_84464 [Collybiopsis luxurians FD-317 M1]|uniref:Uncharacterized protein n=1 Tax=Collybiopsis luxurians FD-317 M1 TaxID=944289 RepID=A0A0D0BFF5_9AGAR|nr:hypothetical protein GYMLUDRAFT_84464 [Collybiopsis luxurians FD-317 M1]